MKIQLCCAPKNINLRIIRVSGKNRTRLSELGFIKDKIICVKNATNKLCYYFVISMPLKRKGYAYIEDLNFINKADINLAAFHYSFDKYIQSPNEDYLQDLELFYYHLLKKKFLNKSEKILFDEY